MIFLAVMLIEDVVPSESPVVVCAASMIKASCVGFGVLHILLFLDTGDVMDAVMLALVQMVMRGVARRYCNDGDTIDHISSAATPSRESKQSLESLA
jgi:translation elongation factor EF-Tu-like GTPase